MGCIMYLVLAVFSIIFELSVHEINSLPINSHADIINLHGLITVRKEEKDSNLALHTHDIKVFA